MGVIRDELSSIREQYGDAPGQTSGIGGPEHPGSRRTEIVPFEDEIQAIDLVPDESTVLMLTNQGYVKRMPTREYRVQARGGKGVKSGTGRDDEDFIVEVFEASAHASVLLFTNTGRVFRKRVFEFPLGSRTSRGKALVNFLDLKEDEQILEMVPYREDEVDDDHFVVLGSAQGYIKRTSLSDYANIRTSGLIAAHVAEGDRLIDARLTDGTQHLVMASSKGMSIRFPETDVRPMGRTARGVRGMALREGDRVVSMLTLGAEDPDDLLTLSQHGFGKRTPAAEYRPQSRAGLGLKTIKTSERNGLVVGMLKVREGDQGDPHAGRRDLAAGPRHARGDGDPHGW
jgi:DNA gyrase subunit A